MHEIMVSMFSFVPQSAQWMSIGVTAVINDNPGGGVMAPGGSLIGLLSCVRLLVRSACVAGYNRQPRTHAPALLHYLVTSQQLAVRRTRKQNKGLLSFVMVGQSAL